MSGFLNLVFLYSEKKKKIKKFSKNATFYKNFGLLWVKYFYLPINVYILLLDGIIKVGDRLWIKAGY